jgi:DNA-binding NtrC family response regulator
MSKKILIVEDEFIVANDLRLILDREGYLVCGVAASVQEARELIKQQKPRLVLLDIHLKGKLTGIDLAKQLREEDIAFVYLSANSNQRVLEEAKATEPYGFLVKPFREKDVLVTLDIAWYRHEHSLESRLHKESLLQNLFIDISNEAIKWEQKLLKVAMVIQPHIPFDYLTAIMKSAEKNDSSGCSFFRIGFEQYQVIGSKELSVISGLKTEELKRLQAAAPVDKIAAYYNERDFEKICQQPAKELLAKTFDLASVLVMPLFLAGGKIFPLCFYSRRPDAYNTDHLALLSRLQQSLSIVIESILSKEKMDAFSESSENKVALMQEIEIISNFESIIGSSPPLLNVLDLATQVAPLDTSVLLLGESGTGKEKIARCIHDLSPRKIKPLIKVNCGALPASLIESELFGHEKGSFTGATDKRTGKFEQADEGTIFLDEIGELPLDLQVKLLRVLQEKEIERIGGKAPVKIDVRIIAATNRNLEKEVAEGRFRLDLYYRLNVFPILSPSLRERKGDIKQLAHYFALQCCSRMKKKFAGISKQMIDELEAYQWPGNIRELENIIEQSVILNDGKSELILRRPLRNTIISENNINESINHDQTIKTLTDVKHLQHQTERDYIFSILKKTNGRIRGKGGAAELLNIKPTTLESRMAKLGIKKEEI